MLVLDVKYYQAWSAILDPAVRYWIRLWQDGLHGGTHPEWTFSPLSISCLGQLWGLFIHVPGKPDWGSPQRRAIKALASRRSPFPDANRFPIPAGDDSGWDQYWTEVAAAVDEFRKQLFEDTKSLVCSGESTPDYQRIADYTGSLAAEVLGTGYSDLELFVRAGTGVLDPRGQRSQPHAERVRGLLEHLERRPQTEFVATTEIFRTGKRLSRRLARRLAPLELNSPEEWRGASGFVQLEGKALAITRCLESHSITAFLKHRFEASEGLRVRSVKLIIPGLRLAQTSQVYQLPRSDRPPWQHSSPMTNTFQYLSPPDPRIEAEAFAGGIEAIDDDPEETIRLLCDAFERKLGDDWPKRAGRAYRSGLRGSLGRRLLITLQETRERRKPGETLPQWVESVPANSQVDFVQTAQAIRDSGVHADELLARRLEAVARDDTTYRTAGWINALLYLAKGVRNREVHAGAWPTELRGVAAFLARVLLYTFVSTFPAPKQAVGSANAPP